jgi:hypothetical protein
VSFGFASAGVTFGFALDRAVEPFGFAAEAGLLAVADPAVAGVALGFAAGFGFAAAAPVGLAVADFGAFFAPAFGVVLRAAGLRAVVPEARVRAVFVEPGVSAPVLVPPARVGSGAVSVLVVGASSS